MNRSPDPAGTETQPPAEKPPPAEVRPSAEDQRDAAVGAADVAQLQAEVRALRARLDSRRRRAAGIRTARAITAAVLAALAAFATVAAVVGVWAARTTLDTDRWVATVTPLPKDPKVAAAVARYATAEVFRVVDVEQRLREVLPEQAGFVVGPITGQVRDQVQRTLDSLIRSDRFQQVWVTANRRAHQQALAILEDRSTAVRARDDRVVIDLLPLINQVLREVSARLPTLFGRQLNLPDLSSGEVPQRLRSTVEEALGVTLPANFAQFTIYDDGRLAALQQVLLAFKRGVAFLVIGAVLAFALALAVAPRRRRCLLQFGVWLVVAAIATTAILRVVRADLLAQVPAGIYRDGVTATIITVTRSLHDRGVQLIWFGALLAAGAYLFGPGRLPVQTRRLAATGALVAGRGVARSATLAASHGPGWTARHRDAVRIAGVVVAGAVALLLSSWTGLIVVAVALAGYQVLVTIVTRR